MDFSFYYPRAWYEAMIARAEGDRTKAQLAFARTREILATRLKQKPDDPRTLAVLAQVDAGLEKKEEAIAEATRAMQLMPMSRDAYDAPLVLQSLAQVYTWTNETERALNIVRSLLNMPGYLTQGYLRVDPAWTPLRNDPRFKAFVGSLPLLAKDEAAVGLQAATLLEFDRAITLWRESASFPRVRLCGCG